MTLPRVTAVVLNWCNEEVSRACLRSLDGSDYHPLAVVLVDNASPDASGERLREAFPHIDYLQTESNLGYAGGNNRGIRWALDRGTDYVLVLNNDTELEPGAIRRMVEAATGPLPGRTANRPIGGVSPKILYHHAPDRIWFGGGSFSALRGLGVHWREGEPDDPGETGRLPITFMTGACCLLSAAALQELGGFDETFFAYVEDAELSLRMTRAGWAMVYQPAARVLHHSPPPGTPPTPFQIRQRDRNRRRTMRKHFPLHRRLPFLMRFYLTRGLLFGRYAATGHGDRARAILEGMRDP